MKSCTLILLGALMPLAFAAPSPSKLQVLSSKYSTAVHQENLSHLSRVKRQDSSGDEIFAQLGEIAANTLYYYGCPLDAERFAGIASTAFQTAFEDTTEDDFEYWDFARKFVAQAVTLYDCAAGSVTPQSSGFEDRFKAAQLVALTEEDLHGNPELKTFAADFISSYGCGRPDTENGAFIIVYLSTLADVYSESSDSDTGLDLARAHYAKLISRIGCGSPDANSNAFKRFFNNWAGN